jgi:hypothetical protein
MSRFTFAEAGLPAARRRAAALAAALVLLGAKPALAHGFMHFASTPVTPPKGFGWVFVSFALVTVAVNIVRLKKLRRWPLDSAVLVSAAPPRDPRGGRRLRGESAQGTDSEGDP